MTRLRALNFLISTLLLAPNLLHAAEDAGTQQCLSCHDYSDHSPVKPLQDSPHWQKNNTAAPRNKGGCEACHGDSGEHVQRPIQQAPEVSYGPRWNSGVESQTAQCQTCHVDNAGQHWEGGAHQQENLTCNSCHSGHAAEDKAIAAGSQQAVCTVCHKPQKDGMHDLEAHKGDDPACSQCHNPHSNSRASLTMLDNRSAGCVHCHNLVAMSKAPGANPKAVSYHKTMTQRGRLCVDCHQGIAHASTQGVAPVVAQGVGKKTVSVFAPGQSDSEWLLSRHPGAQSLRQGRDCEQCHQGEEAQMGESLSPRGQVASRNIDVSFRIGDESLRMKLQWQGPADDQLVAVMWGNDGNEAFRRGGCWATCHSDMPGMTQDRGQAQAKYLSVARAQQQRIGQPALLKSATEIEALRQKGAFVEMWQARLASEDKGEVRAATILGGLQWKDNSELTGKVEFSKGRWTVTLTRPLKGGPGDAKSFLPGKHYTFGIALQGAGQEAGAHWVTLPMTFSLDDRETDFISPAAR